jgi:RNA polymerase sigma-70 factor (ECF subfamily)
MTTTRLEATQLQAGLAALTDGEVVRRVLDGDTPLFEILMRRHNQRVYRAVRSVLRADRDVDDAMQNAWLQAFSHLSQYEGGSAFSTWLTRIALNEALQRVRQRSRVSLVAEAPERESDMPPTDPERRASDRELARMLEASIDGLPETYRTVFVLREVDHLSTAEAAEVLGISEDLVKVRLHRARLALRDALYERAGASAADAFSFLGPRCDRIVAAVFARLPPRAG